MNWCERIGIFFPLIIRILCFSIDFSFTLELLMHVNANLKEKMEFDWLLKPLN